MKFIITYQQEVEVDAKDGSVALYEMTHNIPHIEVRGASVANGGYRLNSGMFKIISCKEVK